MNERVMMMFALVNEVFSRWIESVSELTASLLGRFVSPTIVRLVEDEDGEFVLQRPEAVGAVEFASPLRLFEDNLGQMRSKGPLAALSGSRIELVLRSDRFIFRPLELPHRAAEFMPGIVRSQIDRLTPWNAADAAFGWGNPVEVAGEKIVVTIAATTLTLLKPYIQVFADIDAHSILVFADLQEGSPNANPIKVWEQTGRNAKDVGQIRQTLTRVLAAACITAAIAISANVVMGVRLTAHQDEITRQISGARFALGTTTALGALRALERRKGDSPSVVLALEALSKILPDQTYVTELQIEGNKLRLTGITRDAPPLIGLIEQSDRFARASFFAPTTRSDSNAGDRFHIEVVVKALGPSS
jgi:general secretion pathway protein L